MEFDFTFKLGDGAELTVSAECTEDDTLISGMVCEGCFSAKRLLDAYIHFESIEARAREVYEERSAAVIAERREAGIAGEGECA